MLLWSLASAAIGCSGTWLAIRYALHRNLLDQPGERRSHRVATPRGGGISIVIAMLAALATLAFRQPQAVAAIACAALGLVAVATVGWIDDHRPLSSWLRLGVHALAGVALAWAIRLSGGDWPEAAQAFLAAVVLTNVWNFMDGINGLAASQAALVAAAWALFAGQGPVAWLGLALAAAACGFLPFNLPRARIFLGDVGSGALGYALAGLLALAALGVDPSRRILLTLPLLPFLIDASLTLSVRILRGEAWWQAHVQHAYQAWSRVLGRHQPVTAAYAAATLLASAVMLGLRSFGTGLIMFMYMTLLLAGGLSWRRLRAME
ncbi:MAG: hypothetical protein KIS72_05995 [Luteimonas sp.]|nr:hypothetical protein [Luteimonas sp.]